MVTGQTIRHGGNVKDTDVYPHDFTWTVDGANCKPLMYIRYDAHGKKNDTWYMYNMTVTLSIVAK